MQESDLDEKMSFLDATNSSTRRSRDGMFFKAEHLTSVTLDVLFGDMGAWALF